MDKIELQTLVAGAIIPFLVSILKRWITPTKEQVSLLVIFFCFVISSVFQLFEDNFNWSSYLSKVVEVYGTSQIVYWAVLKSLELDVRIEGK